MLRFSDSSDPAIVSNHMETRLKFPSENVPLKVKVSFMTVFAKIENIAENPYRPISTIFFDLSF